MNKKKKESKPFIIKNIMLCTKIIEIIILLFVLFYIIYYLNYLNL